MKRLSIVTLVHNEAEVIEDVLRGLYQRIASKIPDSEIVVCEDGSTDATKEILKGLAQEIPLVLHMGDEKKGYTRALHDAFSLARGQLIFFTDSDAQHNPDDFWKLYEQISDYDLVSGYKLVRKDSFFRVIFSKVMNDLVGIMFGLWIGDTNSGFKLFRREVVEKLIAKKWFFSDCVMVELVIRAHQNAARIVSVPVRHYTRLGASRSFPTKKLPKAAIKVFRNLIRLKILRLLRH